MRVSMSAIGSVSICSSPTRLRHTRDLAVVRELAQADPAEAELPIDGARATAAPAAGVLPHLEARRPLLLVDQGLLGHLLISPVFVDGEGQSERAEQRECVLIGLRRCRDRDVQAPDPGDVVVVDLREDELLADPDRVVAPPVERPRAEPSEITDARQRDRDEPIKKLVHPVAAERHARSDRHALADLEARDRLAGAAHLRALPRDRRQLLDRAVERLGLRLGLADAHVQRDLLDPRHLHDRAEAKLVLELLTYLLEVALLQARNVARLFPRCGRCHLSISWPQSARRQTRIRVGPLLTSRVMVPTRVGRLQTGQTIITFEIGIGPAFSITPPGWICGAPIRLGFDIGRGRVCRLITFRFSTMTRPSFGRASRTRPCLPRSLPLSTCTRSPFLTFIAFIRGPPGRARRSS